MRSLIIFVALCIVGSFADTGAASYQGGSGSTSGTARVVISGYSPVGSASGAFTAGTSSFSTSASGDTLFHFVSSGSSGGTGCGTYGQYLPTVSVYDSANSVALWSGVTYNNNVVFFARLKSNSVIEVTVQASVATCTASVSGVQLTAFLPVSN